MSLCLGSHSWVGAHHSEVERQSVLLWPAGHVALDGAQDTFGFLSWMHIVSSCPASPPPPPQVLFDTPKFYCLFLLCSSPSLHQYWELPWHRCNIFYLILLNLMRFPFSFPLPELVEVSVDGILSFRCVNCTMPSSDYKRCQAVERENLMYALVFTVFICKQSMCLFHSTIP